MNTHTSHERYKWFVFMRHHRLIRIVVVSSINRLSTCMTYLIARKHSRKPFGIKKSRIRKRAVVSKRRKCTEEAMVINSRAESRSVYFKIFWLIRICCRLFTKRGSTEAQRSGGKAENNNQRWSKTRRKICGRRRFETTRLVTP